MPSVIWIQSNGAGAGDWVRVFVGDELVSDGHSLSKHDVCDLLERLGHTVIRELNLTDEEIE